jgi:tRNA threonylcarbamoyladenosine dehydratase
MQDLERRFGGLRRLYGQLEYDRLRAAHVAVVGLGGVGSWSAEVLARSGVASLTLIDMDHVAPSNINRQVQAHQHTLGQAKGLAMSERIATIHPGCQVHLIDDFVTPDNWPGLLGHHVDALIDACDQISAKVTLAV